MVVPDSLRWLLTVALTGATVFHFVRVLRPRIEHQHRIADSLHAVMGVAMVGMLWPFGHLVPAPAWLVIFAGSAGWFAAQASRATRRRLIPAYFATAAAAMIWMIEAMPAAPAMSMPGMSHATPGMGHATPGMSHATPGRSAWAGAAIGCYLVAAGLAWTLSGLRLRALRVGDAGPAASSPWHWPALCHGVMSVSMGLAVLTLI